MEGVEYVKGNPLKKGEWQKKVKDAETVINLAGYPIFLRWTDERKRKIYESRVLTTRNLVEALDDGMHLLNASAVGYYGSRGDEILNELSQPGNDFLARVTADWENEALKAEEKGVKVSICRFGTVLGNGGILKMLYPLFRWYMGGEIGSGRQWFSWIHIEDLYMVFRFLIENELEGIFNCTSPNPVTNSEFTGFLSKAVKRPAIFRIPSSILRLIFGEFADVITGGQRAIPERLIDEGFEFLYPNIEEALGDVLRTF